MKTRIAYAIISSIVILFGTIYAIQYSSNQAMNSYPCEQGVK